ncbi:hypothetical protein GCM10010524_30470 [Streptomyces mexicanus]
MRRQGRPSQDPGTRSPPVSHRPSGSGRGPVPVAFSSPIGPRTATASVPEAGTQQRRPPVARPVPWDLDRVAFECEGPGSHLGGRGAA